MRQLVNLLRLYLRKRISAAGEQIRVLYFYLEEGRYGALNTEPQMAAAHSRGCGPGDMLTVGRVS